MATRVGSGKKRAADPQTDVTDIRRSKRLRLKRPDRQGHKAPNRQPQSTDPNNANMLIKHRGTELSTSIHSLPPELMAMIFSQLNPRDRVNAACVCSRWRDLIDIPSVWRDFCPIIDIDKMTSKHIETMHVRMISKVEICKCGTMNNMIHFLQLLPHLKYLSVNFSLNNIRFCRRKETLPSIKHLTITCSELNTGVLRSLLQPMVNLQDLRLNCVPDGDLFCALGHSKRLVSLHIKSKQVGVQLAGPSMDNLIPIISMKHLVLVNITVGDSGLDFISRAFPQLHTLVFMLSSSVTFDGLEKLAKLMQLKTLKFGSEHFEHGWMEHLDTRLPQLDSLVLFGCLSTVISTECFKSISKLPALSVLRVQIRNQEVEGLHALSQGCSSLQMLYLFYGNGSINQGLHVINSMPKLRDLILTLCSVDDNFWHENSKSFSKLRMLCLVECPLVSEQCLPYLSQMPSLEALKVRRCLAFGNNGLNHLVKWGRFNSLTYLFLMELKIKNNSLVVLSKHTPSLKHLRIVSCENVTEGGLAAAVSNLPHLKVLETDLSAGIKDRLKRILPHLTVLLWRGVLVKTGNGS